jgi:hypothetical protein
LFSAHLSAAISSRKRKLSATASSASSDATGARSEASSVDRAHLGSQDERGSTQPENDLGALLEAVEQRVRASCAASASSKMATYRWWNPL